jgi:LPS-assembly protein
MGPDWQFTTNYNYVSDLDYQLNFNNSAIDANTYQFPQQAQLAYSGEHWDFTGLVQNYQVLGDNILLPNIPYNRLPELDLGSQYPNFFGPLSFGFSSQLVNFQKNPLSGVPNPVEGQRANVSPTLSLPMTASYGYFTPTITASGTQYSLSNAAINGYTDNNISRTLPIFDVDTGLYFTRNFLWNGQSFSQTLEPRLFYLYVPYQNQNNIPVFDTGIQDFSYNSLFLTNRFTGIDRIGDANQISAALSTTVNNGQGNKVLTAAVGDIFYFENRQVSLCQNQPGQPPCIATEQPGYNQPRSDIAGIFTYNFDNNWALNTGATYNTFDSEMDSQSYELQYAFDPVHLINFGYQDNRYEYSLLTNQQLLAGQAPPTLSQLTASFVWQLVPQWSFVGLANYSLNQSLMVNVFGGLEYSSCCWAIQLLEERYLTSSDPNNPNDFNGPATTATVIQFELKGLGGTSSNMDTILAQIPGYNSQQTGF